MNRRELLRKLLEQTTALAGAAFACRCTGSVLRTERNAETLLTGEKKNPPPALPPDAQATPPQDPSQLDDELSVRQVAAYDPDKIQNFDKTHAGDLFVSVKDQGLLASCVHKLRLIRNHIGYSHFNLLGFDEFVSLCKSKQSCGPLTARELVFLEEMFFFDAKKYGFLGEKITSRLTHKISDKDVIKIPHSGHYLFKEEALPTYQRLTKDIGPSLVLTSGVRNIVKQMQLFLDKTIESKGNLSQASRSLAPPGYSYHIAGDFDVGKAGLGPYNFTERFSQTQEYKKLLTLGYIGIRYPSDNHFGVRFEPWHIESKHRQTQIIS